MAALSRDLVSNLEARDRSFSRVYKSAAQSAKVFERELAKVEAAQRKVQDAQEQVGTGLLMFGAAVGVGLGLAAREAIRWESAWAGVVKTVSGSPAQMAALEEELRGLARTLPATHGEIAAVAEAAGQLGVQRANVAEFTETMIALGVSTNLAATDAATALARLSEIMGTSQADVDRLGSVIVALGNSSATTEAEIVEMGLRIAGAGATIGASESDVLALAAALSSVGIRAEAGGTAISRVMLDIGAAVDDGGDKVAQFARVAGLSAEEFTAAFREDPVRAITAFIEGLGRISNAGGNVTAILEDLSLSEIRVRDTLLRTSEAGDLLRRSLNLGAEAWRDNVALVEEANRRYATTESRLRIARNQVNDLAIDVGNAFLPAIGAAADRTGAWVEVIRELPGPVKQAAAIVGGLAAAATLAAGAFLVAAPRIARFKESLEGLGPRGQFFGRQLSRIGGILTGPFGAALAGSAVLLGLWLDKKAQAAAETREFMRALEEDSGVIAENSRAYVINRLEQEGALEAADRLGIQYGTLVDAIAEGGPALARINDRLDEHEIVTLRTKDSLGALGDEELATQQAVDLLRGTVSLTNTTIRDGVAAFERKREAMEQTGDAAANLTPTQQALGEALGLTGQEAKQAAEAVDQLSEELNALFTAAFGLEEAQDALQDRLAALRERVEEHGAATRGNTQAVRDNKEAVRGVIQAALELIEAEARAGATSAQLAEKTRTLKTDLFNTLIQMGLSRAEATRYTAVLDNVPGVVSTLIKTPGMRPAQANTLTLAERFRALPKSKRTQIALGGVPRAEAQLDRLTRDRTVFVGLAVQGGGVHIRAFSGRSGRAQAGGLVEGPGTGISDSIPMMLSNREFVVRASIVNQPGVLEFLTALNTGRLSMLPTVPAAPAAAAPAPGPAPSTRDLARTVGREVARALDGATLVVDDRGRGRLVSRQADLLARAG